MKTITKYGRLLTVPMMIGILALSSGSVLAAQGTGQSSLTVACGGVTACNATDTPWEITKTGVKDTTNNKVTWTINVIKGQVSDQFLTFKGFLTITNTGSAPATIGNIVVNLQRSQSGGKLVTVSSDVANAAEGDAATKANICSSGSSEGLSLFTENAGSSTLEFTDASNNTVFSIKPQKVIAVGETITLNYIAKYDVTKLASNAPLVDEIVRLEAIVSFGNSGARGGSSASCSNVDVSGDGNLSSDEAYVRSVPCRTGLIIPELEASNATVTLSDDANKITTGGTLTFTEFWTDIGAGAGVELLSDSATRHVNVTVNPGNNGGTVSNCAYLNASPIPACNASVDLKACDTQEFDAKQQFLSFCTYTQGGYHGTGTPGQIFDNYFVSTFRNQNTGVAGTSGTGGLMIGNFGNNGTATPNGAFWQANTTGRGELKSYLTGGGTSAALTTDTLNAPSVTGGALAKQTTTLTLNVEFSGVVTSPFTMPNGFGSLVYHNTGDSLDGKTVLQILDAANAALNNGTFPLGYNFGSLNTLVTNLNESFDNCSTTGGTQWALDHLKAL